MTDPAMRAAVLKRLKREVRCQTLLTHPNIVPVLVSDFAAEPPFYVMPLASSSLDKELLAHPSGLSEDNAIRIMTQVLEAVAYAHQEQIIHRDLKPGNILIYDGIARVTDFGLGRDLANDSSLTVVGKPGGTERYAAPEQWKDMHAATTRSDVYSLGLIFAELLIGRRRKSDIPERFKYIIYRASSEDEDERFADATDMLHEVQLLNRAPDEEDSLKVARKLVERAHLGDSKALVELAKLLIARHDDARLYFDVLIEVPSDVMDDFASTQPVLLEAIWRNLVALLDGPLPVSTRHRVAFFMQMLFAVPTTAATKRGVLRASAEMYLNDRGWFLRQRFGNVAARAISSATHQGLLVSVLSEGDLALEPLLEVVAGVRGGRDFLRRHGFEN